VRHQTQFSVYYLIVVLHDNPMDGEFSSLPDGEGEFSEEFVRAVEKGWRKFVIVPLVQQSVEDPTLLGHLLSVWFCSTCLSSNCFVLIFLFLPSGLLFRSWNMCRFAQFFSEY
jgi:hypothetical protein